MALVKDDLDSTAWDVGKNRRNPNAIDALLCRNVTRTMDKTLIRQALGLFASGLLLAAPAGAQASQEAPKEASQAPERQPADAQKATLETSATPAKPGTAAAPTLGGVPKPPPIPMGQGEYLELQDMLRIAVQNNPQLKAAALEVAVREAGEKSVTRHMLPTVRVEAKAMLWNDKFHFKRFQNELGPMLGQMAQQMGGGTAPQGPMPDLTLNVRDQFMLTFQAMIIEPLGSLYQIYQGGQAKAHMTDAARHDLKAEQSKLELQLVEAYFNHISASKMLEVTEAALKQVEAFEKKTRQYMDAGLAEKRSLLKVEVQRQQLQQNQLQAQKGVRLTLAMMNMLMNRPLDTPFGIRCLKDKSCETAKFDRTLHGQDLVQLQNEAVDHRPELLSARQQREAAGRGAKAKSAALLPELNAVVAYQHNHGTGEIMPEDAVFGGLMLNWNVFEWGATQAEADEASLQHQKAQAAISAAEAGIRLDVHQKRLELEEAMAGRGVAKAAKDLAAENLRLEEAGYEVQNTTATDLLAAQTAHVKADIEYTVAEMKVRLAERQLWVALGRSLLETP